MKKSVLELGEYDKRYSNELITWLPLASVDSPHFWTIILEGVDYGNNYLFEFKGADLVVDSSKPFIYLQDRDIERMLGFVKKDNMTIDEGGVIN